MSVRNLAATQLPAHQALHPNGFTTWSTSTVHMQCPFKILQGLQLCEICTDMTHFDLRINLNLLCLLTFQ